MAFVSDLLTYGGIALQLATLVLLVRGPFTRYFPVFLYLITLLGVTAAGSWVARTRGVADELYFNVFWGGELLLGLLLFFLVISLTTRALEGNPLRPKVVRMLAVVTALALVFPFFVFDSNPFGRRWNQSVSQIFNFGAAVMNLVLWSALIATRNKDRQLFTMSAGLGVMVAAAAFTMGVRQFTLRDDPLRVVTDIVYRVSQMLGPLIWCYAFRLTKKAGTATPPAIVTSSVG